MPEWMVLAEPERLAATPSSSKPQRPTPLDVYAEAALDGAVQAIISAPDGKQHETLNRESYTIAQLAAGNVIPAGLAVESLCWAASQMRSFDARRPWRQTELDKLVRAAFADGLAHPRRPRAAA
jgi:hypothetical protein